MNGIRVRLNSWLPNPKDTKLDGHTKKLTALCLTM